MDVKPQNPDDRSPLQELGDTLRPAVLASGGCQPPGGVLQELGDTLRPAVEQVRAQPVPPEALDRAVDRAQRLGPPVVRPRRRRKWLTLAAGMAALVLVSVGVRHYWPKPKDGKAPTVVAANAPRTHVPGAPPTEESAREVPELHNPHFDTKVRMRSGYVASMSRSVAADAKPTTRTFREAPSRASQPSLGSSEQHSLLPMAAGPPAAVGGRPTDTPPVSETYTRGRLRDANEEERKPPPALLGPAKPGRTPVNMESLPELGAVVITGQDSKAISAAMKAIKDRDGTSNTIAIGESKSQGQGTGKSQGEGSNSGAGKADEAREQKGADKSGVEGGEIRRAQTEKELLVKRLQGMELARRRTPGAFSIDDLQATRKQLKAVNERLEALRRGTAGQSDGKKADQAPQVWHRDASRPTFARVYVGDGNALELVSLQVTVTVEGPRARTVVDHVFRNPHARQLEGTFEYPLPTGASPSYFAMFLGQTRDTVPARFGRRGDTPPLPAEALARLSPAELVRQVNTADWGTLQEARVVSQQKALETYEEVVRGRIDPALLEYAGGNTFRGRVFPIPPRGYNRVILAYEELLPFAGERMLYRFPLPHCKLTDMQFTLQAAARECKQAAFLPKDARQEQGGSHVRFTRSWSNTTPEGEVVFSCVPANPRIQAVSGRQGENGPHYLYARLRPDFRQVRRDRPFADRAVFLLDTSLSEHPDRFGVTMKLLRRILEDDPDIRLFNILTFNVGAAWVDSRGWMPNTKVGRETAFQRLDGLVLEGATDLSCALDKLVKPGFEVVAGTPLNVFLLSDGHITWGESDVASLVARFEQRCPFLTRFHCYRTGLGEENAELFETLTRKGGGVFQCFGEADLAAAARAHRSECLQVERVRFVGGPGSGDVLVAGRRAAVYPGGELVVAARFNGTGRTTVVLEGTLQGKPAAEEFPLEVQDKSELAARGWAEVAVASLLALHDPNLDTVVTAYCQQFGIVSRVASFLVLENENDYKRLNLEEERGRTLPGDLGRFVSDAWSAMGKAVSGREDFNRFLRQVDRRVPLFAGPNGVHVGKLLALLADADFELPEGSVRGALLHRADVSPAYLAGREQDRRDVGPYLAEARRRVREGDADGAVRVLSSVIEEHPTRGDALRLVGYRLLDLKRPALAARLFRQVQRQRPFEPHSYRDLARSLEDSGRYGLAAVQYEVVLAGTWHARFGDALRPVVQEEYAAMMQDAIRRRAVGRELADHFGERLEKMANPQPKSDLRVTISWNTDATDVDLWVHEPDGTKCYYGQNRTPSGGELSQDQTQGYGPERYRVARAAPGTYTVKVHYFRPNPNLLAGETHVNVVVTRHAGTPQEVSERHTVILKKHNEEVEVCKIKF